MSEESKRIDPDATVAQPLAALDPEATVTQPLSAVDPEATVTLPFARTEPDPEATDRRPAFDPEATVNPAERLGLASEATVRIPSPGKARNNPFAPKSSPESIQGNLASLGGLNPLVAIANPILGAVPQIRRTLKHPDAAMLRANLRDQIESLQASAITADIPDSAVDVASYALCALLDESAAATPWGVSWAENGLLKEVRGEFGGGEGFFKLLDRVQADQGAEKDGNADLLEFFYICLALGFEGRYRTAEGGRQALELIRNGLYAAISRRRPRPDGLSARWRSAVAEAAAAPALQVASEVSARLSAQAAAQASAARPAPAPAPSFLSRLPRRMVWSALAAFVGAVIVFYLLALRLLEDETSSALASRPLGKAKVVQAAAPAAPAPVAAPEPAAPAALLSKALEGEALSISNQAGGVTIALRSERQFAAGSALPAPDLHLLIRKIAAALDRMPGAIVVAGHADASPTHSARFSSNAELSEARARSVAQLMAPKLGDPKRLSTEGKGESEPLAPGKTQADLAKNRRVVIILKPAP